jgi:hypothetical protein
MAKHARIRRERAEREALALEEKEQGKPRGPISEKEAEKRAREWRVAGLTRGHWAFGTRTRRDIKQNSSFKEKRPKKRRVEKRGRR